MYFLVQETVLLSCNTSLDRIKYIKDAQARLNPDIKYQIKTLQELLDNAKPSPQLPEFV